MNEYTWQPCGLTPDITCLIAPSLPAASIAWKISSTRPAVLGVEPGLQVLQRVHPEGQHLLGLFALEGEAGGIGRVVFVEAEFLLPSTRYRSTTFRASFFMA